MLILRTTWEWITHPVTSLFVPAHGSRPAVDGPDPWAIRYPEAIERLIEERSEHGIEARDLVLAVRQWVENDEPLHDFQLRQCQNGHMLPQGKTLCPACTAAGPGVRVVQVNDPDTGEHLGDLVLCAKCGESGGMAYGYCGPCNMREAG